MIFSAFQDNRGTPLERWQMCSKEEEPLVLQQFLRFGETRPITQQLILQELSERSNEEHRVRVQSEIKKLMERNSVAAAAAQQQLAAAAQAAALRPPQTSPLTMNNNGLHQNNKQRAESNKQIIDGNFEGARTVPGDSEGRRSRRAARRRAQAPRARWASGQGPRR